MSLSEAEVRRVVNLSCVPPWTLDPSDTEWMLKKGIYFVYNWQEIKNSDQEIVVLFFEAWTTWCIAELSKGIPKTATAPWIMARERAIYQLYLFSELFKLFIRSNVEQSFNPRLSIESAQSDHSSVEALIQVSQIYKKQNNIKEPKERKFALITAMTKQNGPIKNIDSFGGLLTTKLSEMLLSTRHLFLINDVSNLYNYLPDENVSLERVLVLAANEAYGSYNLFLGRQGEISFEKLIGLDVRLTRLLCSYEVTVSAEKVNIFLSENYEQEDI